MRCVHVKLPDGTIEYLVTNIIEKHFTESELKELYFLRWGVESKYRELKNRFQIEAFSGLKAINIKQDFYTAMFISNLVSIAKYEADKLVYERTNSQNNHKYQSNRSFLINRIKSQFVRMLMMQSSKMEKLIMTIIEEASAVLSIIRPNRQFKRFVKDSRRKQYMHMKPCL